MSNRTARPFSCPESTGTMAYLAEAGAEEPESPLAMARRVALETRDGARWYLAEFPGTIATVRNRIADARASLASTLARPRSLVRGHRRIWCRTSRTQMAAALRAYDRITKL